MGRQAATHKAQGAHDAAPAAPGASTPPPARVASTGFATASHTDLFVAAAGPRCDVCSTPLDPKDTEKHGAGVYMWARGDDVRREEAPLCASCSGVIVASAMGMIDFDDEE